MHSLTTDGRVYQARQAFKRHFWLYALPILLLIIAVLENLPESSTNALSWSDSTDAGQNLQPASVEQSDFFTFAGFSTPHPLADDDPIIRLLTSPNHPHDSNSELRIPKTGVDPSGLSALAASPDLLTHLDSQNLARVHHASAVNEYSSAVRELVQKAVNNHPLSTELDASENYTLLLDLRFKPSGELLQAHISQSSGKSELDEAVRNLLHSQNFPEPPAQLERRKLRFSLRIGLPAE